MTDRLVRALLPAPIDVVGDVHGELEALSALFWKLGYDEQGRHLQVEPHLQAVPQAQAFPLLLAVSLAVAEFEPRSLAMDFM
jgi:hypothetical protein